MKKNKETRTYNAEMRASEDGNNVTGYAALYNSESEEMWGFREIIAPGAFDETDLSDVRALFNHDPNMLLARTSSGTLKVERDDKGLKYSFSLPDTTAGRDLSILLERGDVSQSSFGFAIAANGEEWEEKTDNDGNILEVTRKITKIDRLYDVSPVTYPAYADTSVALRSLEAWRKEGKQEEKEERQINTPLRDRAEAILLNPNTQK